MGNVVTLPATGATAALHNEPIRMLDPVEKMKSRFDTIFELSNLSFDATLRPPESVLKHAYLNYDVFVKEFGGQLLGFGIVAERNGEPYLWHFAVSPKFRRMGIATQLLSAIRDRYTSEGRN